MKDTAQNSYLKQSGLLLLCIVFLSGALLPSCAANKGSVVQEIDDVQTTDIGNKDLEQKVEQVREKTQTEKSQEAQEIRKVTKAARRISASEYLDRFPQARSVNEDYIIGSKDILTVKVYNEPDLTQEDIRVSSDGFISFPFIGAVKAAGWTAAEIEREISSQLASQGYLVDPHVSVMVKEYRSNKVLVLGSVRDPGTYRLEESLRVLNLLSRAGGVDFEQGGNIVTLVREEKVNGKRQKLAIQINLRELFSGQQPETNLVLEDQDVIFVPKAAKVYVIGQVQSPGEYILGNQRLSLVEAIGQAGGFTRIAARKRVRVLRQTRKGEKTFVINVQQVMEKGWEGQELELQSGDVVVVPERFF